MRQKTRIGSLALAIGLGVAAVLLTTVSFARRSKEAPAFNRQFAVAVILASTIMFPRLLLQISIVNHTLMKRMAVPILAMAGTGLVVAAFYYLRSRQQQAAEAQQLQLRNPFSLGGAINFALILVNTAIANKQITAIKASSMLPQAIPIPTSQ